MKCSACGEAVSTAGEAFTGDVCPQCHRFAHPTRLGEFEHLELIKRGGMSAVYRARHPRVGTTVAIKVIQNTIGAENLLERARHEAGVAARIPHPGVVRVLDFDSQEGRLYLVLEHVDGITLRQAMQSGSRDVAWALDMATQIASVLSAAHVHGVVHRDIKPENVMIDTVGRVRVLDFGLSRLLGAEERLTRTGEILGTPEYMAPEQILDEADAVDARTDVYALGVVLYEMLSGRSPFSGPNLFSVLKLVESKTPETLTDVPDALAGLVATMLEKDRHARPRDAGVVLQRLLELQGTGQPRATRRWWLAAGALALGFLAGMLYAPRDVVVNFDAQGIAPEIVEPFDAQSMRRIADTMPAPWFRSFGERARDHSILEAGLLEIGDHPTADDLRAFASHVDRNLPHRYLIEAVAAVRDGDLDRLRACAELAAVTGAGDFGVELYLAGRAWLCPRAEEAAGLLAFGQHSELRDHAAGTATRALLAFAARDGQRARDALATLPDDAPQFFREWKAIPPGPERKLFEARAILAVDGPCDRPALLTIARNAPSPSCVSATACLFVALAEFERSSTGDLWDRVVLDVARRVGDGMNLGQFIAAVEAIRVPKPLGEIALALSEDVADRFLEEHPENLAAMFPLVRWTMALGQGDALRDHERLESLHTIFKHLEAPPHRDG